MPPVTAPSSANSRQDYLGEVTAVLTAIAMLAAARIILLLSAIGAFVLAYMAIANPSAPALIAAGSFDLLVVIPVIALFWQRG